MRRQGASRECCVGRLRRVLDPGDLFLADLAEVLDGVGAHCATVGIVQHRQDAADGGDVNDAAVVTEAIAVCSSYWVAKTTAAENVVFTMPTKQYNAAAMSPSPTAPSAMQRAGSTSRIPLSSISGRDKSSTAPAGYQSANSRQHAVARASSSAHASTQNPQRATS